VGYWADLLAFMGYRMQNFRVVSLLVGLGPNWFTEHEPIKKNYTKSKMIMEKVYFTPNLRGSEHISPQPMKIDFLPRDLSKTGQSPPKAVLKKHSKSRGNHKMENLIVLDFK
jgi:hypothetical protein